MTRTGASRRPTRPTGPRKVSRPQDPAETQADRAADVVARMPAKAPPDTSRLVRSPMPGLIVKVVVAVGQEVKAGQELCVLEAMKMENEVDAERAGTVTEVRASAGDNVSSGDVLFVLE